MKEEIRQYLLSNSAAGGVETLSDDESLLDAGVIDSVAMVGLISHLEKTYGISIDEDDMIPENFETVDVITQYVSSKQSIA